MSRVLLFTRSEHGCSADLDTAELLENIACLDIIDDLGVDLCALGSGLQNNREQIFRIHVLETTLASSADRCTDRSMNNTFVGRRDVARN